MAKKKAKTTKKKAKKKAASKKGALVTTKKATSLKANQSEIATLEEHGLSEILVGEGAEGWGAGFDLENNSEIYSNDLLIPKIWLAQKMSDFLGGDEKIEVGDFVNSLTLKKMSTAEEGVDFTVVKTFKRWQAFSFDDAGSKVYERELSGIMTLENAKWKYEDVIDGKKIKRSQVNSFIILLASDIAAGNPQPYCIDFTRSSRQGGRKLVSDLKTNTSKVFEIGGKKMKLPSPAFAYKVTAFHESFDKGECFCKDVTPIGFTNKAAVNLAKEVYDFVKHNENEIEFDDRDMLDDQGDINAEAAKVGSKVGGTSDI